MNREQRRALEHRKPDGVLNPGGNTTKQEVNYDFGITEDGSHLVVVISQPCKNLVLTPEQAKQFADNLLQGIQAAALRKAALK